MSMAFDTLRYAQRLQQVGVAREQAEAHAELARDMVIADLATKADIAALRVDITAVRTDLDAKATKADLGAVVKDLQAEIKLLEQRMTIKLGAMLAAGIGLVIAEQKLF
jgi:hypothetical protein